MSVDLERLHLRFAQTLKQAGAVPPDDAAADLLFEELVQRHGEAHRHYHTLEHVDACLTWLDWSAGLALRPAEVALALWFHGAVYELGASDNEARSAALARAHLARAGLSPGAIDRVGAHILATRAHDVGHPDSRLVVDIDLSILGSARTRFDAFERQIRLEYGHVPDALFRAGRRELLGSFLRRPTIYSHRSFREQLEMRARANLERRLTELSP